MQFLLAAAQGGRAELVEIPLSPSRGFEEDALTTLPRMKCDSALGGRQRSCRLTLAATILWNVERMKNSFCESSESHVELYVENPSHCCCCYDKQCCV